MDPVVSPGIHPLPITSEGPLEEFRFPLLTAMGHSSSDFLSVPGSTKLNKFQIHKKSSKQVHNEKEKN